MEAAGNLPQQAAGTENTHKIKRWRRFGWGGLALSAVATAVSGVLWLYGDGGSFSDNSADYLSAFAVYFLALWLPCLLVWLPYFKIPAMGCGASGAVYFGAVLCMAYGWFNGADMFFGIMVIVYDICAACAILSAVVLGLRYRKWHNLAPGRQVAVGFVATAAVLVFVPSLLQLAVV